MLSQLAYVKGLAVDLLFPRWCVGCGREGDLLCCSCRDSLTRVGLVVCPRCGRPPSSCSDCSRELASIDGIRSPFTFEGTIRKAIHELKYRNIRALAPELAGLLADYLRAQPVPADLLAPVPLHPARLRERGYNQSGLLARELSRVSGIPATEDCLVRVRQTPPQARTGHRQERLDNMAGAFACRGDHFRDKHVMIIDDVATSGATLDACASAAKRGGAVSVWGLVVAREI